MIGYAYRVRSFQISGGPGWIDSDRHDVLAKPEKQAKGDEILQMVQTLLAERFQLRLHREMQNAPIYALLIGKNGSKLEAAKNESIGGMTISRTLLKATGQTMEQFAVSLSNMLGRPVLDKTGLTGRFDFQTALRLIRAL